MIAAHCLLLLFTATTHAVQTLNDDTFEKITQASTGMTTGSHFIKFYVKWCPNCKDLKPQFEATEKELEQNNPNNILFDQVDCNAKNTVRTCKRFNITSYPMVKLLHRSQLYDYYGPRPFKAKGNTGMIQWLRMSLEEMTSVPWFSRVNDIPPEISWFGNEIDWIRRDFNELWKDEEKGRKQIITIFFVSIFIGMCSKYSLFLGIGLVFSCERLISISGLKWFKKDVDELLNEKVNVIVCIVCVGLMFGVLKYNMLYSMVQKKKKED